MASLSTLGARIYRGETAYDFVGRRKFWYAVSILLVIVSLTGLGVRGLFLGVEFQGGAVFTVPASAELSTDDGRRIAEEASGNDARVQELGSGALRVQVTGLDTDESDTVRAAIADEVGLQPTEIDAELVGPSWGQQMTTKAFQGMIVFLVLVTIYLAFAFEWRMSLAALVAMAFDLLVTVGVYALVGFEVTPGSVVGLLTILGYSLYDTVVVFDKVQEKTRIVLKQSRYTYGELANQGINSVVVRSINTSVTALLPVAGLLFIGTGLLAGGMLKDIALPLFVGLAAGTFSSIFIATPLVVDFRLRDPEIAAHNRRILDKRAERGTPAPSPAAHGRIEDDGSGEAGDAADADGTGPVGTAAVPAPGNGGDNDGSGETGDYVTVQRRQPVSRARGRGRPSGKRR
ncbi:protein translocase subunit SecF [Streptomyces calidiresistens]|uniref:Protein-export membrane protein SecF n=1 Tax=Streptomyces calidiresistens TaxID=1485586 RepID=A0A7W3T613_9ACTN|nr:protein translocase subunit SecF [Streptomyces calidiresistens]MBB0231448.1 protein translocase subunit SecF [Streptomyces calidiresistens]